MFVVSASMPAETVPVSLLTGSDGSSFGDELSLQAVKSMAENAREVNAMDVIFMMYVDVLP
jgi:hypothetical protein